jgi:hypothetical protein
MTAVSNPLPLKSLRMMRRWIFHPIHVQGDPIEPATTLLDISDAEQAQMLTALRQSRQAGL